MKKEKQNNVLSGGTMERFRPQKSPEEIKRVYLMKLLTLLVLTGILVIYTTIAWFTMNKETGTGGMGVKVQSIPFTIQTRSESGYYSTLYNHLATGGTEWKISAENHFNNHVSAIGEGESEPGIEPGDHGALEFRVNPNNADSITVNCVFDIKAYAKTTTSDENGDPVPVVTELQDSTVLGYLKAHIMLFSGFDSITGKYTGLISTDEELRRVLEDQSYTANDTAYTKVYWVWPLYLSNLTSENASEIIYAPSERSDVIAYIANNKDGFFKDCNDSVQKVTSDLTALSTTYSSTTYTHYYIKYDNADLEIGRNASYVMLSMNVE